MFRYALLLTALFSSGDTSNICDILKPYHYSLTGPLNFPWTNQTEACQGFITPKPGYYAVLTINATNMGTGKGPGKTTETDYIIVNVDKINVTYGFRALGEVSSTFNLQIAVPVTFSLEILPLQWSPTKMQLYVDLKIFPNPIGNNLVKKVKLEINKPSELVYFDEMVEGGTYEFTSNNATVQMHPVPANFDEYIHLASFANCWIYSNKTFISSVYGIASSYLFLIYGSDIELLCVERQTIRGAFVFVDSTNTQQYYRSFFYYLPVNNPSMTDVFEVTGDTWGSGVTDQPWGSLSFVGDKDGSTPFDIRQLILNTPRESNVYYTSGGPTDAHSNITLIIKTPVHVTGNFNTLYIDKGYGQIKVTVTN